MSEIYATVFVLFLTLSCSSARLPCNGYENIYVCKEGDPSTFVICSFGYEYEFQCPPGLHFNAKLSICDWPEKSDCELDEDQMAAPDYMPMYEDDENSMVWDMPTTTENPWWERTTSPWWPRKTTAAPWWPRKTTGAPWWPRKTTAAPWWPRKTTKSPWWPKKTTSSHWWPRPRRTTQQWAQQNWIPTKKTPTKPPKPQHGQLTENVWKKKTTTPRYRHNLVRRPLDPWAPITTGVYSTQGPRKDGQTVKTAQVSWKQRQNLEQDRIEVISTTETTTERLTTESPTTVPVPMCPVDKCLLPSCRCPGIDIPGGIPVKKVPQLVMLTFDDKINEENFRYFRKIFTKGRNNPNGCSIKATFFVSKAGTDFAKVEELYKRGHEIASHSKSYRFPHTWWATASYKDYVDEIEGMRKELSKKAHIPYEDIKGMRSPFLQIGGDNQYKVLKDFNYMYDSSMVTGHLLRNRKAPIWPFTLDNPVDCKYSSVEPRPKKSYPGLWEVPITRLYGNDGRACSMADSCTSTRTVKMALKYLRDNFLRHYTKNRAPLGIFVHATWFKEEPHTLDAIQQFIEKLTQLNDVWFVTVSQVIEWTKNPTPIDELKSFEPFSCKRRT